MKSSALVSKIRTFFAKPEKTGPEQGRRGEKLASSYLVQRGFEIIETNFRTRQGEIDLIGICQREIYFIEVKLRNSNSYGSGEESIHPRKQRRILKALLEYLQQHPNYQLWNLHLAALIIQKKEKKYHFDFFEFPLDLENQYHY